MEVLLTFPNQIVTLLAFHEGKKILPDASTTEAQGGNVFEHQQSVMCLHGAFVVSSKKSSNFSPVVKFVFSQF